MTTTATPATSTSPTARARPATSSSSRTTTRRSASSSPASETDGITKDNTLFVFTVEEGDHFAGDRARRPVRWRHDALHVRATGHVTEVNGDLKRLVATYNASHGTTATTDFSVHSDMAPNVYITGNPARDSATARDLEKAMSDMQVTNPLSGRQETRVRRDGRPGRGEAPAHGDGGPGADADVHAVRAGRLLPQRIVRHRRPARGNDLSNCVFLPNTTPPTRRSRGTTAASSPRSARPGSGSSDRASRRSSPGRSSGPTTRTSGRRCSR